jgi:hypothetical protein
MKRKKVKLDAVDEIFVEFKKARRKLLVMSLISLLITFSSLAIVGLKIFYPFHLAIGIGIYLLSFIPLVRRIYMSHKYWKKFKAYKFSKKFYRKEKIRLLLALILIIFSILFLWLRPLDKNPFSNYSEEQITTLVTDDLYKSVTAMDYLETSGNNLLSAIKTNEKEQILLSFEDFLTAVSYSESLTDVHRYFSSIPYGMWDQRTSSFLISYSLYVKKYEIVHRLMKEVSGDQSKKKILNHYIKSFDKNDIYNEMVVRFYQPKTRLRLTVGYLYMKFFSTEKLKSESIFNLLYKKSEQSYSYLRSNFWGTFLNTGQVLIDHTETRMFDTWFPIQKTVATGMGRAIISTRGKNGLITEQDSLIMQNYMEPGDFMLQRRNWHVSNVGIPGFWTHSALYTGDLEFMNNYFSSEFPYQGFNDFKTFIENKYPDIYAQYNQKDDLGYNRSVVEAIEPGVVIQSLPKSSDADFVAVLRPINLSKRDKMLAILKAFDHVGKPYDFNFDFETLDTLVCSEVIYDSYLQNTSSNKIGLNFETSLVNGRKMVSPFDIAKKFVDEYGNENAELKLVYFIESNEKTEKSFVSNTNRFLESVAWSKFSFLQK